MTKSAYTAILCMILFFACTDFHSKTIVVGDSKITFNSQGGERLSDIEAPRGKTVTLPAPKRTGYVFGGWYRDPEQGEEKYGDANESYTVEGHVTMHARWLSEKTVNGIIFVFVEAGTFMMGSPLDEEGRYFDETQHQVTITRGYWIGKYPVTNRQYGKNVPAGEEDHPVVNIDWQEAQDFAAGIGGSLPTEAQWEFAARGGNKSKGYIYSGSNVLDEVGWYEENSNGKAQAIGQKIPNELGIHDMSGNVHEWCQDWYGDYPSTPETDPVSATQDPNTGRVHRGGSRNNAARDCRIADRPYSHTSAKNEFLGLRIVILED